MDTETTRVRRIRPTAKSKMRRGELIDSDLLNGYLNQIAENNEKLAQLQREQNDAMSLLFKTMKSNRLDEWETAKALAKIVTPKGRATNFIDPEKYAETVSEEDFYASVKVSMEQAKKYLSQKELEKITTTTPGKDGEPKLEIDFR